MRTKCPMVSSIFVLNILPYHQDSNNKFVIVFYVSENISKTYDNAEYINGKEMKSPLEIIVVLDGSYDAYTAKQML